jgi:hypothetical protein
MEQLQILDMDAMAVSTEQFSISAYDPGLCRSEAQVSDLALSPAVDSGCQLAAFLADWSKAFVGFRQNVSYGCFGRNGLLDNFDSAKGEIWCYTESGHRRPPLDKVYL